MSNTKTWLGFAFYTQEKLENLKRFKQTRTELEIYNKKKKTHSARDSIDQA